LDFQHFSKAIEMNTKLNSLMTTFLAASCLAAGHAQAANSRTAPIDTFSGTDEIVEACTTATNFVNMPNMSRTFSLGGSPNDEVVVMFQGAAMRLSLGSGFDTGFVRLTIDGAEQPPGLIPLVSEGDAPAGHGFNWQSKPLTPGPHTARIQWRTDLGNELCVDARSMIVLHK
jgi:hypothetical protein